MTITHCGRDFSIQHAYLETGVLFWQALALSYSLNNCSLYPWQAQQDAYRLLLRLARNQLLDPPEFLLAELIRPRSVNGDRNTRSPPLLITDQKRGRASITVTVYGTWADEFSQQALWWMKQRV